MGWPNKRLRTSYANSAAAAEPSRRSCVAVPSLRHADAASGGQRAAPEIDDCATARQGKGGADASPLPSVSCHIDRLPVGFPTPRPRAATPRFARFPYPFPSRFPFPFALPSFLFRPTPHPSLPPASPSPSRSPSLRPPVDIFPSPFPSFPPNSPPYPPCPPELDELVAIILRDVFKKAQSLSDIASLLLTCRRFYDICRPASHWSLLASASVEALLPTDAAHWTPAVQRFLLSAATEGNIEAIYIAGMVRAGIA
ncbi:unnamed protein product [Closterium sp. NIES-64]|nr:unnamed protein product [Closterium sp. NIES-64]